MNQNSRNIAKLRRKADEHFHGKPCVTDFIRRAENPQNQRKSARKYNPGWLKKDGEILCRMGLPGYPEKPRGKSEWRMNKEAREKALKEAA
jgi:hypothetical protein